MNDPDVKKKCNKALREIKKQYLDKDLPYFKLKFYNDEVSKYVGISRNNNMLISMVEAANQEIIHSRNNELSKLLELNKASTSLIAKKMGVSRSTVNRWKKELKREQEVDLRGTSESGLTYFSKIKSKCRSMLDKLCKSIKSASDEELDETVTYLEEGINICLKEKERRKIN